MSTVPQGLRKRIDDLKTAQAAQMGRMATMGATRDGTVRAMLAGGISLVVGMLMGIIIASGGRRLLL